MDYLDKAKQVRIRYLLMVGYVLVGGAVVMTALILLNVAYGYGIGKHGSVIQNGLVFFSSHPSAASIRVNGQLESVKTNARLYLPEDVYQVKLSRSGYRDWQRNINLPGGSVQHFDYPFLIPSKLTATSLHSYDTAPGLLTQSPDQRWLLVAQPTSLTNFDVYDLKSPTKTSPKPLATTLSLPDGLLSRPTSTESLQLVAWADDNVHFLLQHLYDDKSEYILVDRSDPTKSVNLSSTSLGTPTELELNNKKFNQYYLYDEATQTLSTASLKVPTAVPLLTHVLAFKSYGNNTVLYVTDRGAPAGKVLVKLINGTKTTTLRDLPAGSSYLLDLTTYSGTPYVALGATSENKVYIYQDPLAQLAAQPHQAIVPSQVLHVPAPSYLSFSNTAQFIVAENGPHFGVYDIENKLGYNYTVTTPLDAPQAHATWMDGDRLTYVSNSLLTETDYDNTNRQNLTAASSGYLPAFAPNYKYVYVLAPNNAGQLDLTQTALLTPADL